MRKNLITIQKFISALSKEDFDTVEQLAGELGSMDHSEEALGRRNSMPEGYRSYGPRLHMGFQALSRDARDFGDAQHSLGQLAEVMGTCITCHQSYRLVVSE